ncbi:hypothetical protein GF336_06675 [Candidatus Woesearchaeota archaeon]|nr:hypothetical protein [Candidatus Woesearchaeota archaeon]
MAWKQFDLIEPAIEKTKKLVLPFDIRLWIKLAIVFILAGGMQQGLNFSNVFRIFSEAAENGKHLLDAISQNLLIIIVVAAIVIPFALLLQYICSVFRFIYLDFLNTKGTSIKKSFRKIKKIGSSYFLFNVVISIILTPLFLWLFYNIMVSLASGDFSFWFFIDIGLIAILGLVFALFYFIVNHFMTMHMYLNGSKAMKSLKIVLKKIRADIVEFLKFWLVKMAINIVLSIFSLIVFLAVLMVFLLLGAIITLMVYLISLIIGSNALIIAILIPLIILFLVLFVLAIATATIPLNIAAWYWVIDYMRFFLRKR